MWALTELIAAPMPSYGVFEYYRRKAAELAAAQNDDEEDEEAPFDRPSLIAPVADWRRRYDRRLNRETPLHPECAGGPVEAVNGPGMQSEFARGSLEWAEQQRR